MPENETKPTKTQPRYCPTCHARYAYDAETCVTCDVALTTEHPRDESLFRPKIDLPVIALGVLFVVFYSRLPGEAQSFGLIALVVGISAILVLRYINHVEWQGRR